MLSLVTTLVSRTFCVSVVVTTLPTNVVLVALGGNIGAGGV